MSKIILIEPKPSSAHIFSQFALPRIGLFTLGAMMKKRGWEVEIIVEDIEEFNLAEMGTADIVGISTITPTAPQAYTIADEIRKAGTPVLMGGPHVTFMPDEALNHTDFVIRGEGEIPLMKFIDQWEKGGSYKKVPNLSYRKNDTIIHNPMSDFIKDLDQFPVSDFSLLKNQRTLKVLPVQTSRGCPYDCSFCSVTGMFGKKYRFRSNAHIIEELKTYKDMGKMIFFYDDHFAANKKRAKELLKEMIATGLTFKWSTQVRVEIANDPELLSLMKESGCHTLFIGFESVNPESLKEMNKRQTVEDITKAVETIHDFGIHIHGMFVHGFDNDNWQTVQKTVSFAKDLDLTSSQFLILTPFPGSELYTDKKDTIIIDDWAMYDTHHVVFSPKNFTLKELQKAQNYSHEKFYSVPQIFKKSIAGNWLGAGIGIFARLHNNRWKRNNRDYLNYIDNYQI